MAVFVWSLVIKGLGAVRARVPSLKSSKVPSLKKVVKFLRKNIEAAGVFFYWRQLFGIDTIRLFKPQLWNFEIHLTGWFFQCFFEGGQEAQGEG
jgi:hypothetical protein